MAQKHAKTEPLSSNQSTSEFAFNRLQKVYSLEENRGLLEPTLTEDLRIVIIGKTGVGKSATGNTILGKTAFREDDSPEALTVLSKLASSELKHRDIAVIDTPGLEGYNRSETDILLEVAKVVKMFRNGIHAFIYVLNAASPRFTDEDVRSLDTLEMMFGSSLKDHLLLVYTHAYTSFMKKSLQEFWESQKYKETPIGQLFQKLNWKVVAVNNNSTDYTEKIRNQNVILAMIDKMISKNEMVVYTNSQFTAARTYWQDVVKDMAKQGLSPVFSEFLEKIIDENPEEATNMEYLTKKVKEAVENELRKVQKRYFQKLTEDTKKVTGIEEKIKKMTGKKRKVEDIEAKDLNDDIKEKSDLLEHGDIQQKVKFIRDTNDGYIMKLYSYCKSVWNSVSLSSLKIE